MTRTRSTFRLLFIMVLLAVWFLLLVHMQRAHANNQQVRAADFLDYADQIQGSTAGEESTIPDPSPEPVLARARCGNFFCYSSHEFLELYNRFESQTGLPYFTKYIYDHPQADAYIKTLGEARGYQLRVFADESELVWFEERRTRPEVRDAYIAMRNEMLKEGIRLHFVSSYRSSTKQRSLFTKKIGNADLDRLSEGIYDEVIDKALSRSAMPGYSKHHSGYAMDFGCGNNYLVFSFADTECYQWMSANNFENAKRFGFIPSYPFGVDRQGPNPEPWEYVWIGVENLK